MLTQIKKHIQNIPNVEVIHNSPNKVLYKRAQYNIEVSTHCEGSIIGFYSIIENDEPILHNGSYIPNFWDIDANYIYRGTDPISLVRRIKDLTD